MRRRDFIALLGGAAAMLPLAARAQEPGKRPMVGFLGDTTALGGGERAAAFARRLHDLGWIEGRTRDRVSLGGGKQLARRAERPRTL